MSAPIETENMVYNEEINQMFGELVFPKFQSTIISSKELMEKKMKKTYFKFKTENGKLVAMDDIVPMKIKDVNYSARGYAHTLRIIFSIREHK